MSANPAVWSLIKPLLGVLMFWLGLNSAIAHEVRPAYLQLHETEPGRFEVLFKTPMVGDLRLALRASVSGTAPVTPIVSAPARDAMVQTWSLSSNKGLGGQRIAVEGLEATMTDALVRIDFADGQSWTARLTPASPGAVVPSVPGALDTAITYLALGVEHILLGLDHLLFVLGLFLINGANRRLVWVITAFTVAHSLTLAGATLGFVHVPAKPVEAVIALSIVFVALEALKHGPGSVSVATRAPWIVAFLFGLLHGFGFAGALAEVGLPQGQVPVALLFFNIGVEFGQLLFVGGLLLATAVLHWSKASVPRWASALPAYAIGSIAMFWVIQRVSQF